jgi:hypothetical protein
MHTGFWCVNLRERDHLEDLGIGWRIILKWIFKEWDGGHGMVQSGSGQGHVVGSCECGVEPLGCIYVGTFLTS